MSFKKVMLVGFVSACVMLLVVALPGVYGQPSTNSPSKLVVQRSEISSTVIPVTWRNAANPDTIIRVFNGPAARTLDTIREVIPVWGANTIAVQIKYTEIQDSALVKFYAQISLDGTNWAYLGQKSGATDTLQVGAIDSSGAYDTVGSVTHVVNIGSPPTYARYMRLIVVKMLSASTDTMKVQAWVNLNRNDE